MVCTVRVLYVRHHRFIGVWPGGQYRRLRAVENIPMYVWMWLSIAIHYTQKEYSRETLQQYTLNKESVLS